jgi:hypothetical protein
MKVTGSLRENIFRALALACLSLVLVPALAHHSQSEFDSRLPVDVEGKVTKLEWKSPHARLYLDVVNRDGATENWNFELPSPTTLMRRGWMRDSLKVGDKVTVTGSRARNFPTIAYARTIKDHEGKPMFTGVTKIHEPEPVSDPVTGSNPGKTISP